jgi:transcription elongation factor Elf1
MASFARKIKRKQLAAAKKKFMKDFKSAMKNFKKQVKCSVCGRVPRSGENIDNWHIDQESNNIDLICTECHFQSQGVQND